MDTHLASVEGMFHTLLSENPPKCLDDTLKGFLVASGFLHGFAIIKIPGAMECLYPTLLNAFGFTKHILNLIPGAIV